MKNGLVFLSLLTLITIITFSFEEILVSNLSYSQAQQQQPEQQPEKQQQYSEENVVVIVRGAANPEVDITDLTPRQWYNPTQITIKGNETVEWINEDTEHHTVTSGTGGGISSLLTNSQGNPTGLFDSGLFSSGETFSLQFNQTGIFDYFCTIHPWMEGTVSVTDEGISIPPYAVDTLGNEITDFPIYEFTDNEQVEIGLSWNPRSIVTNEPVSFIMDFFKFPENSRLHLWPYNFIILQEGKETYRTSGISQIGSSSQTYTFGSAGETTIRVENVDNQRSFVEFGTIVYENPFGGSENVENVSSRTFSLISPLMLVYVVYAIIIVIPLALVVIIVLYKKQKI